MAVLKNVRPEPVLDEGKVAGLITGAATALLTIAAVLGFVTQEDVDTLVPLLVGVAGAVVTLINFVVPKIRAMKARKFVTPLADPQNNQGQKLVPASSAAVNQGLPGGANPEPPLYG